MFFFLTIISSIFLNARVGINGNEDSLNQKANVVSVYLLNGYAVAYSIHSNSNLIIRLHLDFNLSLCDENLDESIITDISVSGNKRISEGTRTDNNYSTSLGNYYLLNLYDSGKLSFYEGGGPYFQYRDNGSEYNSDLIEGGGLEEQNNYLCCRFKTCLRT